MQFNGLVVTHVGDGGEDDEDGYDVCHEIHFFPVYAKTSLIVDFKGCLSIVKFKLMYKNYF